MSITEFLPRVREGSLLDAAEIRNFANGLADGTVSDAQAAAFAMAVCVNGLSEPERIEPYACDARFRSGSFLALPGPVIDKHSTGGVGDNASLVLAPALAVCGGFVPMVSGRGLGHTGGTLDKLEAIPGYQTEVSPELFQKVVGEVVVPSSEPRRALPADKRLYAIRDLTGTVESVDLITSSILSKKLAAGLEALVLASKWARELFSAKPKRPGLWPIRWCEWPMAGCPTIALLTDMNEPLATSAGNALEVESALRVLRNEPGEEQAFGSLPSPRIEAYGCIRSGGKRKFGGGKAFGLPQVRSCGGEIRKNDCGAWRSFRFRRATGKTFAQTQGRFRVPCEILRLSRGHERPDFGRGRIELGRRAKANDSLDHSVGLDRIATARLGEPRFRREIRFCVSVRLMMPRPGGFHLFWMMPFVFSENPSRTPGSH